MNKQNDINIALSILREIDLHEIPLHRLNRLRIAGQRLATLETNRINAILNAALMINDSINTLRLTIKALNKDLLAQKKKVAMISDIDKMPS